MRLHRLAPWLAAVVSLGALFGAAGCRSGDGDLSSDGVILSVVPDRSGEAPDVVFAAVPDLLVTSDGRAIYAAPEEFAYQGTLVADVWVVTVGSDGLSTVRAAVADGTGPRNIAELSALVPTDLGNAERYFPDVFRFAATEIGPVASFDDPEAPLVVWPATASIPLAEATDCTRLPELEVGEVFVTAAQDSVFVDDGIVYGVVAAPDWPGAPCVLPS